MEFNKIFDREVINIYYNFTDLWNNLLQGKDCCFIHNCRIESYTGKPIPTLQKVKLYKDEENIDNSVVKIYTNILKPSYTLESKKAFLQFCSKYLITYQTIKDKITFADGQIVKDEDEFIHPVDKVWYKLHAARGTFYITSGEIQKWLVNLVGISWEGNCMTNILKLTPISESI